MDKTIKLFFIITACAMQSMFGMQLDQDWTPLMIAANTGDNERCVELLQAGADVNARDKDGFSVLSLAVGSDRVTTSKLLLEAGVLVNAQDNEGRTALMNASEWSDGLRLCKILLEYGAEPEIRNKEGKRAIECVQDAIALDMGAAQLMWPGISDDDRQLALASMTDHSAIPVLLNSPGKISAVVLRGRNNSRLKRLKGDDSNVFVAILKRELNGK